MEFRADGVLCMGMSLMGKVSGVGKKPGSALERRYIKPCKNTVQVFNVKSRSIEYKNIPPGNSHCAKFTSHNRYNVIQRLEFNSTLSQESRVGCSGKTIPRLQRKWRLWFAGAKSGPPRSVSHRRNNCEDLLYTPKRRGFQEIGATYYGHASLTIAFPALTPYARLSKSRINQPFYWNKYIYVFFLFIK